jgi:hypothetical protein
MKYIVYLITVLLSGETYSQNVVFHLFRPTASVPQVIKWNVKNDSLAKYKIKETFDNNERVTSLTFLKGNEIYDAVPDAVPSIKYEYKGDTIYEYYYGVKGMPLAENDTVEFPFYRKYVLSNDKKHILKTYALYGNILISQKTKYVLYYIYSSKKDNGIFPMVKDFHFDKQTLELYYYNKIIETLKL